jgi:signal transduction histidine kinase
MKKSIEEIKNLDVSKGVRKITKKIDKSIRKFEDQLKNMKTGCKLLSFYVQDLLDLAQMKAGTIKKNFEMTNVNKPLEEIILTQELQAKA